MSGLEFGLYNYVQILHIYIFELYYSFMSKHTFGSFEHVHLCKENGCLGHFDIFVILNQVEVAH